MDGLLFLVYYRFILKGTIMDAPAVNVKKTYKYNQIEFWAENGFVQIYDGRDGSQKAEPTFVMRKRAKALFDEIGRAHV